MSYKAKMNILPGARRESAVSFATLGGGLNLWELDYRLDTDESPEMKNLIWRDGALSCRDGQVWFSGEGSQGRGHAAFEKLFHGWILAHIGDTLCAFDTAAERVEAAVLCSGVPENRGSFFLYGDELFYKNRGAYIRIALDSGSLTAAPVPGYTPVTVINASPLDGSGELYQPENRLSGAKTLWYNAVEGAADYFLPVSDIDSVDAVSVDGRSLNENLDYTVDRRAGKITFASPPPVTDPPTNNSVSVTYTKANPEAYNSVMSCPYAATYGGTGALCIVLGGCEAQPNAYFWNGNNIAMDPGYFPVTQYQLAGDSHDAVTGFGRQQSYLIIFKESSVGRSSMGTQELDGRAVIDLPYVPINSRIGCDLPWTIRLVENNLVWCNAEQGVQMLRDSSSAYENNIRCLSRKVNGTEARGGLLEDVRAGGKDSVCSCDDGHRYWLCANGHAWLWDYELSAESKPAWFYYTGIEARSFIREYDELFHLNAGGRLTVFRRVFADYDGPIEKVFRFATQLFGGYDALKNVNSVIIAMRSDTNAEVRLTYITDYERREDPTTMKAMCWLLSPRNLAFRSLRGRGFAEVFRRRPLCRRVRHFTMRLENSRTGEDLSVVSAQIFYTYQGRQR